MLTKENEILVSIYMLPLMSLNVVHNIDWKGWGIGDGGEERLCPGRMGMCVEMLTLAKNTAHYLKMEYDHNIAYWDC